MTDALSIALSGLRAQSTRLATTASNIANAQSAGALNASTAGSVPSADPSAPASTVYLPLRVNFTSVQSGGIGAGVAATVSEDPNGYSVIYDPSSPYANSEGNIAAPAVDYAEEFVNLLQTKAVWKANLSVIKTQDEMLGDLLDEIA
jgi:flagellar basal-body rod protein FlgC